jgi:hypothetical protein
MTRSGSRLRNDSTDLTQISRVLSHILEWSALLKPMVEECAQTANNIPSYEHLQSVTTQPILSELVEPMRLPATPAR